NPQAGISSGMHINGGDVSAGFNWGFSQGSRRSFVSQTPVITGIPGQPMFLRSGLQVPFVTGFTPVVGGGFVPGGFGGSGLGGAGFQNPNAVMSLRQRWEQAQSRSTRDRTEESSELSSNSAVPRSSEPNSLLADPTPPSRSQRAQARDAIQATADVAAQGLIEKAEQAIADGKPGSAKIYYRMASRRASADLQVEIQDRIRALAD
ncbi:MAG: hypothetical protein O3A00_06885, partial [Planctomycetota bacterium]|nr:hypothetical protein [Planctomycetota bacterium]